ncbi:MAG: type I restriction enzyme HsdR N-terminal domain-containing protein [Chlamydiae bacterium]|nr:type I restriction enzyme HsdR N-terminal domain-containing protein [Chlamydiota bacterium]
MVSSAPNDHEIYDSIRKKWVKATPEEKVRQSLIQKMINELSYPRELICIEKSLSEIPSAHLSKKEFPDRRVDVVCFMKEGRSALRPLLLIECKECSSLAESARQQVIGYNHFIQACFVAIAYPGETEFGYYDKDNQKYVFIKNLPPYNVLMRVIENARKHGN